jgi:hypothetical protein
MKAAGFGCLGLFLGALVGGVIGVAFGFVWTNVSKAIRACWYFSPSCRSA